MTLKTFDLANLRIAPENPRKNRSEGDIATMAASVVAVGLLQSLAGYEENGIGYITSGGTRMDGIKLALTDGRLTAENPLVTDIPVTIVAKDKAIDTGLTANLVQSMMSAADQFKAFHGLHYIEGVDIAEIAARYHTDEAQVRRILKLAELAEPIFAAFESGELRLETAKLYAGCGDVERQARVFDELGPNASSWDVRNALTQNTYQAGDRLVQFIGLDAYQEAGGAIETDLFAECERLVDGHIITQLFDEKRDAFITKLEKAGWLEVEYIGTDGFYETSQRHNKLKPTFKPNKRDRLAIEKSNGTLETIYESHGETSWQWPQRVQERVRKLEAKVAKLTKRSERYSDNQIKIGKAVVRYGHDGFDVEYYVRATKTAEAKGKGSPTKAEQDFSQSYMQQVQRTAGQALMTHIAHNPSRLARALAVLALQNRLDGVQYYGKDVQKEKYAHDIATPEADDRAGLYDGSDTQTERLERLLALSDAELDAELAYAILPKYELGWAGSKTIEGFRKLAELAGFNLADAWQFGAEEIATLNKAQLLRIGNSLGRNTDTFSKSKKREIVIVTGRWCEEQRWTPEFIRTHEPEARDSVSAASEACEDDSAMTEEIEALANPASETVSPEAKAG